MSTRTLNPASAPAPWRSFIHAAEAEGLRAVLFRNSRASLAEPGITVNLAIVNSRKDRELCTDLLTAHASDVMAGLGAQPLRELAVIDDARGGQEFFSSSRGIVVTSFTEAAYPEVVAALGPDGLIARQSISEISDRTIAQIAAEQTRRSGADGRALPVLGFNYLRPFG